MNRKINSILILSCVAGLLTLSGCKDDRMLQGPTDAEVSDASVRVSHPSLAPKGAYRGEIIFRVNNKALGDVKLIDQGIVEMNSVPSQMAAAFRTLKASKVERLIRPMGKYEDAIHEAGLDQWFIVEFDENVDLASAFSVMSSVDEINHVEYSYEIVLHGAEPTAAPLFDFTRTDVMPFNDPRLPEQWNYNNIGDKYWAKAGADINLFEAWKIITGTPNVIVAIVDGGIDITHPDLKASLWVNKGEIPNNNKDDDNNGFVDDIHGYCFVEKTNVLHPDAEGHGTHVAGTVAARNNNNIGVCGVAGGNGEPDSGVRIMSTAIFREGSTKAGKLAEAIVYGALNGATISQNSWGYAFNSGVEELPQSVKVAIDFFIANAGTVLTNGDPRKGQQRDDAPMKGGVMFFSAGNDNLDYPTPPACYEPVVAVSAIAPNFTKASYATYGSWVDISAPGGDMRRYGEKAGVLSTMAPDMMKGKEYHYYHGTSMACPHVSGVAALVLSKHGRQGYTNEQLKKQILASVLPVNLDEVNPDYAGKLGVGTIDAYAALTLENKNKAPEKPVINEAKSTKNAFIANTVYWTVPRDEDDGQPLRYQLYYSDKELTPDNYKKIGDLSGLANGYISGVGTSVGDEMNFTISHLSPETKYHIALIAYDKWGIASEPAFFVAETKKNNPPEITNRPNEPILVLDSQRSVDYLLTINEVDGHNWTYEVGGERSGITEKGTPKGIVLTIRPVMTEGVHTCKVTLTDELRLSKTFEIPFRVVHLNDPVMKSKINPLTVGVKSAPVELSLPSYYEEQYFLQMTYEAESANPAVASTYIDKEGRLFIIGEKPGKTSILVSASNGYKATTTTIEVTVTPDTTSDVFSIWPIPAERDLNIWLNPKHKTANVRLQSVNGELIKQETVAPNKAGVAKIDLRNVTPGSYVLVIETEGRKSAHSILKR